MFERFSDRARRVVVLAQEEARLLDHNYIGTEHILLALLAEEEGIAAQALTSLDISYEPTRAEVERIIGRGGNAPGRHVPFTPRSKKVLELSLRESVAFGHDHIGTEHILLGLVREHEGVAAQILVKEGADADGVRGEVIELIGTEPREEGAPPPRGESPLCPRCQRSLTETAASKTLAAAGPEGETNRQVAVLYCTNCGRALGVLGAAS